jgi:tetratricopeptide (TPR) repeat protein
LEVKLQTSGQPPAVEPAVEESATEVVLVARILGELETPTVADEVQPSAAEESQQAPSTQTAQSPQATSTQTAQSTIDPVDEWAQTVAAVDQDVLLYEDEVVYHDFGDEMQVSEVIVDFDSLVDPAEETAAFDPSAMEGDEPELLPARALALSGLKEEKHKELAHVGFAALAQSEWQKAADSFRSICSARPTDSAALNNFGLALLQQALLIHEERPSMHPAEEPHFEAAVLALRQAAKANQEDVSILCNLATSLTACYRHEAALRVYEAALTHDENDIHSMNGKAVSLIGLRQFDEAISTLRMAAEVSPDDEVISANLHRVSPMG